jgi:hypothetical protein
MSHIVLTEDQFRTISQAYPVEVRDPQGVVVGFIEPLAFSEADLAEAHRRAASSGPWLTGDQVLNHLQALGDAADRGEVQDNAQLRQVLSRLRGKESQ